MPPRDTRRFGPGPYLVGLRRAEHLPEVHPYTLRVIQEIGRLRLDRANVTLLAGENGAGKSSVIEVYAEAMAFERQGGELERLSAPPFIPKPAPVMWRPGPEPAPTPTLHPVLTGTRPRNGYFLRAERFFNVAASIDAGGRFAPDISLYGGVGLHEQSHGQSFLALAANRFGGEGIYLLDEPEAALSVTSQLALLAIIARAATAGAQFIIATHSPILLACPGAQIYELAEDEIAERRYDELEAVALTRAFLDAPERYLAAVLDD